MAQGAQSLERADLPLAAVEQLQQQVANNMSLAAVAYGSLGEVGLSQKLTQVIFIELAALTFPHMLLAAIAEQWRIRKGPTLGFVDHLLNAR